MTKQQFRKELLNKYLNAIEKFNHYLNLETKTKLENEAKETNKRYWMNEVYYWSGVIDHIEIGMKILK